MIRLLTAVVCLALVASLVVAEPTVVVNTTSGPVRGEIGDTVNSVKYAAFLGIRYAKAPVGYLRFKPPVAADPWTDIFDATADGASCIQYNASTTTITGSEDCLFLNVYTPVVDLAETPMNLKPVIFRVYGGAFLSGSATCTLERPDYFLDEDIVYVSLNYRSGLFAYLALGIANATGNAGLKDVVLGLKWVKENVEKFGGNPNNITILGASSGGAIVDYLVISDAAAGLFHAAIDMSGSLLAPWGFQTPAQALSQAEKLAVVMGINWTDRESLLQAFYEAPAEEIVNATTQLAAAFGPFAPTIEDESIATDVFLSRCCIDKYASGNFSKVPHLLGYADQETVVFLNGTVMIRDMVNQCVNAAEQMKIMLPPSIASVYDAMNFSTDYNNNLNESEVRQLVQDSSDILYIEPVDQLQKILAANNDNNPIYYYHLSYFAPGPHHIAANNTLPGSGHGDDLRYIYYIPAENYTENPVANLTLQRTSKMWSNFVKYGNPTPDWLDDYSLNLTWPDSATSGLSLNIGSELTLGPSTVSKRAKTLEKISWSHLRELKGCQ